MGRSHGKAIRERFLDDIEDNEREIRTSRRARVGSSCSDGYCGAYDCERCRPGCSRYVMLECEFCGTEFYPEGSDEVLCDECLKRHRNG
jgi:hypothetical protein